MFCFLSPRKQNVLVNSVEEKKLKTFIHEMCVLISLQLLHIYEDWATDANFACSKFEVVEKQNCSTDL